MRCCYTVCYNHSKALRHDVIKVPKKLSWVVAGQGTTISYTDQLVVVIVKRYTVQYTWHVSVVLELKLLPG